MQQGCNFSTSVYNKSSQQCQKNRFSREIPLPSDFKNPHNHLVHHTYFLPIALLLSILTRWDMSGASKPRWYILSSACNSDHLITNIPLLRTIKHSWGAERTAIFFSKQTLKIRLTKMIFSQRHRGIKKDKSIVIIYWYSIFTKKSIMKPKRSWWKGVLIYHCRDRGEHMFSA